MEFGKAGGGMAYHKGIEYQYSQYRNNFICADRDSAEKESEVGNENNTSKRNK